MKGYYVFLQEETLRRLKLVSVRTGRSASEIVRTAVEQYLDALNPEPEELIITNALIPPQADAKLSVAYRDIPWLLSEIASHKRIRHYVRHSASCKVLGLGEPNDGFFEPRLGDRYVAVRLKDGKRGIDAEDIKAEDLAVLEITVNAK